jgi:SNF2 family DNA or RNA helicase
MMPFVATHDSPMFAHQRAIARKCWLEPAVAVFAEQGVGKTRPVLEVLRARAAWPALVICPNTVTAVWRDQAKQWIDVDAVIVRGDRKARERALASSAPLYIISYEALRTYHYETRPVNPATGRRYVVHRNHIADSGRWRYVIVDESSKIKHHGTQQSRSVHAFGGAPKRIIISGTPITHSPLDLYSQFRFLAPRLFSTWAEFQSHYAEIVKRPLPEGRSKRYSVYNEIVGYKNLDELWARVRPYVIQFKKEDCLDLPPKVYQRVNITLTDAQRRAYDDLVAEFITEIGGTVIVAQNVLERLLRLQQICQGFYTSPTAVDRLMLFPSNPKLDALEELLEEITPQAKVVVWLRYTRDFQSVRDLCLKLKIKCAGIHGATPIEMREQCIRDFQERDETRVMIAQIDTAGFGITLTRATYAIYYSQGFNLDSRQQSEDRIHRIGTTQKCTYIDLVCEETIDETIMENLRTKRAFQGAFDASRFRAAAQGRGEGNGTAADSAATADGEGRRNVCDVQALAGREVHPTEK